MESGEIGKIYFGNWLRDWSQVPPGKAKTKVHQAVVAILNILSMGEFNRPFSEDEIGGYLPSEHMDNPLGGKTAESPDNNDPEAVKKALEDEGSLSPDQKEWLKLERESKQYGPEAIKAAVAESGLPDYIERGKAHAKWMLEKAVREPNEDQWMMELGNALHGIEDYFAHSNFTEVALSLIQDREPLAKKVLVAAKAQGGGFDATTAGGFDEKGQPKIVTGTYGDESHGANKIVSLIEQLKSEVLTGSLRLAFIKGMARIQGRVTGAEVRVAAEVIGAPAAVVGAVGGALGGLAGGFSRGHGFFGTIGSMVEGAEEGAEEGAAAVEGAAGEVGEAAGTGAGNVIGAEEGALLLLYAAPLFAALKVAVDLGLDEAESEKETKASKVDAPKEPGAKKAAPTHSELAKDSPEHYIYPTSRALAVNADRVIGSAVRVARQMPDKEAAVKTAQDPVGEIVAHPSKNQAIWEGPLIEALHKTASNK
jgi:hypothetical protein